MVNKKTVSGPSRATRGSASTVRKRTATTGRVVDPMMVAPIRTRKTTRRVVDRNYTEEEDDTFISNESLYNIDDLYDEHGNLIMDEADEILREEENYGRRVTRSAATRPSYNSNRRAVKEKYSEEEDNFDLTEEELENELRAKKGARAGKISQKANKRAEKLRKKAEKRARRKTPIWAKVVITILILILGLIGFGAYYFFNVYSAASGMLEGNPMDAFLNKKPLAKDEYGRTNILIFGTAEDDEGHGGAMLTDSILVVSLDQDRKIASTFSVPRDLWVSYTVSGEKTLWCSVGYKGKINATYYCKKNDVDGDSDAAARYFAKKITEITDIQIQYYVAVDFNVLRSVVNTLGGIDVDVWATDERGIYDKCMWNLKLNKGMNYNLDGETVLRLARARNAKGGYGLANSNFDREINQQRIMNAIKAKALSAGVLADANKVKEMLVAFGDNVKTNITWAEMGTAIDVASGLHGDVESIDTRSLFGTGNINGQSVVIPRGANIDSESSLYNYNKIQVYLRKELKKDTEDYDKTQQSEE